MSNQFAIAGVTAVLQGALFEVYSNYLAAFDGGKVTVSAVAPDIVQGQVGDSTNSGSQVNLFLHQVTLNSGWRNVGLPSVDASGKNRLKNPPLALDLHYLLTVYGSSDAQAEALLGFAVLFLHENPVISRTGILNALNNLSSHLYSANFLTALSSSGIADQIEMIKLVPDTLGREEVAWLWTALKADYRPTFPFQASVVLIQPDQSDTFALPVLSRNISVLAGPLLQITSVSVPNPDGAAAPGDVVKVNGTSLATVTEILLTYGRLGIQWSITPTTVTDTSITFTVPTGTTTGSAGVYNLAAVVPAQGSTPFQSSNRLPIAIAPNISITNLSATQVSIKCDPPVWEGQSITLAMAGTTTGSANSIAPVTPFTDMTSTPPIISTNTPTFSFSPALANGSYVPCMRVDGVDSPIGINSSPPPAYSGQVTI